MRAPGPGLQRRPCAPTAYWFFNHVPTHAEADTQAREIAAAGCTMVMIQARLSLPHEEYLTAEWLRGDRDAVLAAAAAGLEVGIYDEYNWISGHGGGRTVDGAGELRERHLLWATSTPGGRTARISEIASDSVEVGAWACAGGGDDGATLTLDGPLAEGLDIRASFGGDSVAVDGALDAAHVHDGRITIATHAYRAVVLPGVSVVVSPRTPARLAALRRVGDPLAAQLDDGPGTIWRWTGHDRCVLLNDSPAPRTVTPAADDGAGRRRVELEPAPRLLGEVPRP